MTVKGNFILLSCKQTVVISWRTVSSGVVCFLCTLSIIKRDGWCFFGHTWRKSGPSRSFKFHSMLQSYAAVHYAHPLIPISMTVGQQGTKEGHFKKWSPLTHMPSPAVLSWPTAPGSGRALFGPSCIRLAFNAHQGQNNRTRWVAAHWQGRTCFTLVYKAERYVPGSDTWLFINAEAKISGVEEEETSLSMGRCD